MNIILLTEQDYQQAHTVVLRDHRYRHICRILGAQKGDTLRAGQLNGQLGTAIVVNIASDYITLTVNLNQAPPAKLAVHLILALPRPIVLRRILRSLAELGIAECTFINSAKVEKSFWQSKVLEPSTLQHYLLMGLQQAKDTVLPIIHFNTRFKSFIEDELTTLTATTEHKLLAHPRNATPCPAQTLDARTVLAIGPEGGWTDDEVDHFIDQGFTTVTIGERILRVENALAVLIGALGG